MKRFALVVALVWAGCGGPADLSCDQVCLLPLEIVDDVSWELETFHVKICVDATCSEVDAMRGGAVVPLPGLPVDDSVSMAIPASGHESELHLFLGDGTLTTGQAVHVVVTQPGTGVVVCDMTAHVIDSPPSRCGCPMHALDGFATTR